MDEKLLAFLKDNSIDFVEHRHPPFFTVAEANASGLKFPFVRTKNLFLKDESSRFYMLCMPADDRAPLKGIKSAIGVKELHFASEEELSEKLSIAPGHVSIFALMRDSSVTLLLGRSLIDAKSVGFHPNDNTSTLELSHSGFMKFLSKLKNAQQVIDIA